MCGQSTPSAEKLKGVWVLDVGRSTFGAIFFPGAPPDLKITGQELRIEVGAGTIRLSGKTAIQTGGSTIPQEEDTTLRLDGTEYKVGTAVLFLRPIDDLTFEIVSSVKQG